MTNEYPTNPTVGEFIDILKKLDPTYTIEVTTPEMEWLGIEDVKPDPLEKGNYIITTVY